LKLLSFDTSTEFCSVSLVLGDTVLSRECMAGNQHSELLLPMVGELLAEAGLSLAQLDGIAFGRGPGSFTGLRIGCGVAQGLALGVDLPVVGVISLEAMAWEARAERVITCLDARMHEVYYAAYRRVGESLHCEIEPCVCKPDAVPIPEGEGWHAGGSGFGAYPDVLYTRLRQSIASRVPDLWPHARAIAALAEPRFLAGEGLLADLAEPYYVRDKVALTTRERREARQ
jgi:tRNA threonylcarbamoyladenosine biosynthesis protein TsaB